MTNNQHSSAVMDMMDVNEAPPEGELDISEIALETEGDTIWNETQLAAMVGFDNESPQAVTPLIGNESGTLVEGGPPVNQSAVKNAVGQAELFDDPVEGKTKATFASNPFAKAVGVGIPIAIILGGAALFMSGITGQKTKTAPSMADKSVPATSTTKPNDDFDGDSKGNLKTQVALGKQAEQIKAIDRAKGPGKALVKNQKTSQVKKTSTPATPYTPAPAYTPRTETVYRAAPLSASSPSFSQRSSSPPLSQVSRSSSSPTTASSKASPDPAQQLAALSQIGSYGKVSFDDATKNSSSKTSTPVSTGPVSLDAIASAAIPVTYNQPGGLASPLSNPAMVSTTLNQNIDASESGPELSQSSQSEESRILSDTPMRRLQVGNLAKGTLSTPIVWSRDANNNGGFQLGQTASSVSQEEFVVQLTEPLSDGDGNEVLPSNTEVVAQVSNVGESGLITLKADRAVINGQEYVLPQGAISIRGADGKPLIASKWDKSPSNFFTDAENFFLGAASKIGQVLTQPDSQSSSAVSGTGFSSSTTSQSGGKDLFGALLDGGFTPLAQRITASNQASVQNYKSEAHLWYLPVGKGVQVFVNHSFEF